MYKLNSRCWQLQTLRNKCSSKSRLPRKYSQKDKILASSSCLHHEEGVRVTKIPGKSQKGGDEQIRLDCETAAALTYFLFTAETHDKTMGIQL